MQLDSKEIRFFSFMGLFVVILGIGLYTSDIIVGKATTLEEAEMANAIPEPTKELIIETAQTTTYFYAGANQLAVKLSNDIEYLHQDYLGSTRLSSTGVKSKFLPFGQTILEDGRYGYSRKESDNTELQYFNARYYDANVGRFLSVDLIEGDFPYEYAHNNPTNMVDYGGEAAALALTIPLAAPVIGTGAIMATGAGVVVVGTALLMHENAEAWHAEFMVNPTGPSMSNGFAAAVPMSTVSSSLHPVAMDSPIDLGLPHHTGNTEPIPNLDFGPLVNTPAPIENRVHTGNTEKPPEVASGPLITTPPPEMPKLEGYSDPTIAQGPVVLKAVELTINPDRSKTFVHDSGRIINIPPKVVKKLNKANYPDGHLENAAERLGVALDPGKLTHIVAPGINGARFFVEYNHASNTFTITDYMKSSEHPSKGQWVKKTRK